MRLFGGKIGFVGSGIHSRSSQILSKSFRNWFENRTLRGTKSCKSQDLWLFFLFHSRKRLRYIKELIIWYIQQI